MTQSIFDEINSTERMGNILDHAGATAPTVADWEKTEEWLKDPDNEKKVQELWEQAACIAYIDGEQVAAAWLEKKVKDPSLKLPSAAEELYQIYQRCKEGA